MNIVGAGSQGPCSWIADQVRNDVVICGAWAEALGAVRAAEALVAEVEASTAGASLDEEEAWLPRHVAACARMEDAVGRAMRVAAPDLAAFAAKLDLLFAYGVEPGAFHED